MAPSQGVAVEGAAPAGAWSIFKPLSWPQGKKQFKAAHEGETMQMFYDPLSKKWLEKGKEAEAAADPGNAPPPTLLPSVAVPNLPTSRSRTRKPITERYALQNNLGISSSLDTLNLGRTASAPLPPCSYISPPASTSNFFIPGPSPTCHTLLNHDSAPIKGQALGPNQDSSPAPHLACPDSSTYSPVQATQVMPPSTPSPADNFHQAEASCSTAASSNSSSAALANVSDTETLLGVPALISNELDSPPAAAAAHQSSADLLPPSGVAATNHTSNAANCNAIHRTHSEPGSKSLHNGLKFALPRAFTNWNSFQSALISASSDSTSNRDQDFDAAMHPGTAAKLDGPLPWELPGQLRYSQDFLSICTAWQRRNPGKLYSPQQLLPKGLPAVGEMQESDSCCLEVVGFLQQMVKSLKSNKLVSDEELKHAISLLSSLMACQEVQGGQPTTPTKAEPTAALVEDAQKLHTPERRPSAFVHSESPELQSPFAKQVSARFASKVSDTSATGKPCTLSEQCLELQLATMRQDMQGDFEQKLAARTEELAADFESKVAAMRQELEAEFERRVLEKDVELKSQRERCAELQDDLDHLLLCLGQESRKVTDLSQAMKDAGLDADAITMSIEEEYALIDLATSY